MALCRSLDGETASPFHRQAAQVLVSLKKRSSLLPHHACKKKVVSVSELIFPFRCSEGEVIHRRQPNNYRKYKVLNYRKGGQFHRPKGGQFHRPP